MSDDFTFRTRRMQRFPVTSNRPHTTSPLNEQPCGRASLKSHTIVTLFRKSPSFISSYLQTHTQKNGLFLPTHWSYLGRGRQSGRTSAAIAVIGPAGSATYKAGNGSAFFRLKRAGREGKAALSRVRQLHLARRWKLDSARDRSAFFHLTDFWTGALRFSVRGLSERFPLHGAICPCRYLCAPFYFF